MDMNERSRRLGEYRTALGIKGDELSAMMGYAGSMVSQWETGRRTSIPESVPLDSLDKFREYVRKGCLLGTIEDMSTPLPEAKCAGLVGGAQQVFDNLTKWGVHLVGHVPQHEVTRNRIDSVAKSANVVLIDVSSLPQHLVEYVILVSSSLGVPCVRFQGSMPIRTRTYLMGRGLIPLSVGRNLDQEDLDCLPTVGWSSEESLLVGTLKKMRASLGLPDLPVWLADPVPFSVRASRRQGRLYSGKTVYAWPTHMITHALETLGGPRDLANGKDATRTTVISPSSPTSEGVPEGTTVAPASEDVPAVSYPVAGEVVAPVAVHKEPDTRTTTPAPAPVAVRPPPIPFQKKVKSPSDLVDVASEAYRKEIQGILADGIASLQRQIGAIGEKNTKLLREVEDCRGDPLVREALEAEKRKSALLEVQTAALRARLDDAQITREVLEDDLRKALGRLKEFDDAGVVIVKKPGRVAKDA